jgi:hypothetical protein
MFDVSVNCVIERMQRFPAIGSVSRAQFFGFATSPLLMQEQDVRGEIAPIPELTVDGWIPRRGATP